MRRISYLTSTAVAVCLTCATVYAYAELKPAARIVEQADAPVKITSYSARYIRGSQYTTEGIHHELKYQNNSDRQIEALQVGLISFDVWNQFLDRTNGLSTSSLASGKAGSGTWIARAYGDFSFLTGVAYVRRVRFADGTIWTADEDRIVEELRQIEKDFDASILKKKEGSEDK
ncbi:MAG TPA: hypothetical protein VM364_07895 [Vicinamibacterales bacterium]|nr:hypothetical protein [Vicinamibacterales bacterium]